MKYMKFLVSFVLVMVILAGQVSAVLAAPERIAGTVQSITLETNIDTAVTTVLITLSDNGVSKTVRVNIDSAIALGIVILGGDGNPVINEAILGQLVEIDTSAVIEGQLHQHPVGDALATFFEDIVDLDYETIMAVHDEGTGFGVIAQALWLTKKLDGNVEVFLAIVDAKKTKDFSAFVLEDGTSPTNWGQFKNAVMDGKKGKPGVAISINNNENNNRSGNGSNNGNGHGKDKENNRDRENNGRANGQDN
jgi:hypothetical protein